MPISTFHAFGYLRKRLLPKAAHSRTTGAWNFHTPAQMMNNFYATLWFDFGPAKNQTINPSTGNTSTSKVHNTFVPVDADDPKIEMMAQILRAKTIIPPIPYSISRTST